MPFSPAFDKGSIRSFLEDINQRSQLIIEYATSVVDTGKIIEIYDNPATIGAVLQQVLNAQKVRVTEMNGKLILTPASTPLPGDALLSWYTIFGFVKDEASGEPLTGATVWDPARHRGVYANQHGYFTIKVPEGKQTLQFSYAGYTTVAITLAGLQQDRRKDIKLQTVPPITEVVISEEQRQKKEGADKVNAEDYNNVLGEPDVLRSLYQLPGVKNVADIPNGILVRGGNPGENLFLLDGNPVFNPMHLLGSLPIVNQTALKNMYVYKSNFPSRFGGGLSSVMDVNTKDGNMKKWKGVINAGVLAGSFTIEGPLKKDRTAIMLSFRHSWVNPFLRLIQRGVNLNFYDLQFKVTQLIGKKDKLMLNVYAGDDNLHLREGSIDNRHQWGNKNLALTWNRVLGPKAFVNTSVNLSSYNNIAGFRYSLYDSSGAMVQNKVYNIFSSIRQYNIRSVLELTPANNWRMNMGGKMSYTKIKPFTRNVTQDFIDDPDEFSAFPALSFREFVLFYESDLKVGKRLTVRPGIHYSHYLYKDFSFNSWQPRFYAAYRLNAHQQLSFSWSQMGQYLHQVTNPYMGVNSDAWVPATRKLQPEQSRMVNAGYHYQNKKLGTFSAEFYYKKLQNVTNYIEGKNLFLNNKSWEKSVQTGKGWSYGGEFMFFKKTEKWTARLSYTLSWNWRQFRSVNKGAKFPFKCDRRHDLSVAASYQIGKRWNCAALWTFATGDVFTLPSYVYPDFDDAQQIKDPLAPDEYRLIYQYTNSRVYRTPSYHRLDVSAGFHHLLKPELPAKLIIGIYNVYGAPSQYLYDLEGSIGRRSLVVSTRYQFFSITPYLSYNISF
ncbi:TonB-dependent receptor [Pseudoflavitalea rhizosphaerae]|uniref:TonB-dependent receptor n=1 Tax=Pseudoflavitalea rhizosphaerae TaxID=1884793 RepID=UPI0013E03188|nr:TonB-dependent receptor [Pseudoflavitalea rhizosphaerae]